MPTAHHRKDCPGRLLAVLVLLIADLLAVAVLVGCVTR